MEQKILSELQSTHNALSDPSIKTSILTSENVMFVFACFMVGLGLGFVIFSLVSYYKDIYRDKPKIIKVKKVTRYRGHFQRYKNGYKKMISSTRPRRQHHEFLKSVD